MVEDQRRPHIHSREGDGGRHPDREECRWWLTEGVSEVYSFFHFEAVKGVGVVGGGGVDKRGHDPTSILRGSTVPSFDSGSLPLPEGVPVCRSGTDSDLCPGPESCRPSHESPNEGSGRPG